MNGLQMDTVDNKFIIMARIAVLLRKKGFISNVSLIDDFAILCVQIKNGEEYSIVEYTTNSTEAELLDWMQILNDEEDA